MVIQVCQPLVLGAITFGKLHDRVGIRTIQHHALAFAHVALVGRRFRYRVRDGASLPRLQVVARSIQVDAPKGSQWVLKLASRLFKT